MADTPDTDTDTDSIGTALVYTDRSRPHIASCHTNKSGFSREHQQDLNSMVIFTINYCLG
jgi:hypothetical protein